MLLGIGPVGITGLAGGGTTGSASTWKRCRLAPNWRATTSAHSNARCEGSEKSVGKVIRRTLND
jgi:hypothetical protein